MKNTISEQDFQALKAILNATNTGYASSTTLRFTHPDDPNITVQVDFTALHAKANGQVFYTGQSWLTGLEPTHYKTAGYEACHFTGKGSRDDTKRQAVRRLLADLTGITDFRASWDC